MDGRETDDSSDSRAPSLPTMSGRTVAIADDDESVLHAMAGLFRARGDWHVVGTASTGDELVDLVVTHRPLAVVSDVYLPSGEAPLFRRLHELVPRPSVVLAISARATPSLRRRLQAVGADDLLRKGLDDPVAAVERLLGERAGDPA